jgi:transcriptional regulator with XRE-family HTH domain
MTTKNHVGRRISELRKLQGLTLKEMADRSGLTKGYLSKIEHAKVPPPFSTLEKIAGAVDVDINDLLASGQTEFGARNIDFLPPESTRRHSFRSDGVCSFRPLLKRYRNKQMSPFFMSIQPGKTKAFKHDAEEFVYIISGNIEMRYDGGSYHFKTGDSFYLDSRISHMFVNDSGAEVQLLVVDYNYRRF